MENKMETNWNGKEHGNHDNGLCRDYEDPFVHSYLAKRKYLKGGERRYMEGLCKGFGLRLPKK